MNNYVFVGDKKQGKLGISAFVFEQIASDTIEALAANELKDHLILVNKRKKYKVESSIDKRGKITLKLSLFFTSDTDVPASSKLVQDKVYNAVISSTDVGSLNVNISVASIINK